MGFIERTIGLFSPAAATRREMDKLKLAAVRSEIERREARPGGGARAYQGASRGRRMAGVKASAASPDEVLRQGGSVLRDRCRDLVRNNPHAANIVQKHVDNIIGDGIVPKAIGASEARSKEINDLFEKFSREIDPERLVTFYGKQAEAVRMMVTVGEAIIRKRTRRLSDGLTVPLQIQLLEPEFLDDAMTKASRGNDRVESGIQFDPIGGRRGYWLFSQNPRSPTSDYRTNRTSGFVPANEVAHLFEKRNTVRGEPWLAPVITRLYDLDDYDGSERLRKKIEACNVGVITPAEDAEDDPDNPERLGLAPTAREPQFDEDGVEIPFAESEAWPLVDRYGDDVELMEPGHFYYARGGSTVEFNTPASSNGYDTYMRTSLKALSAGARLPYEIMTGDLSEVSFASGRMGRVEYRAFVRDIQWLWVIPMMCQPVWDWFIEAARMTGDIDVNEVVNVEWTTPAVESIAPIDDATADRNNVRNGFMSWDEAVIKRGYDPDRVAAQIVKRNAFWDQNGVVVDTDPRRISQNGQIHQSAGNAAPSEGASDAPGEQDREARGLTGRRARPARRRPAAEDDD